MHALVDGRCTLDGAIGDGMWRLPAMKGEGRAAGKRRCATADLCADSHIVDEDCVSVIAM